MTEQKIQAADGTKKFTSVEIAAWAAKEAACKNYYIDLSKLQMLVYCCCGAWLAVTGKPLCADAPYADLYGPRFNYFDHWALGKGEPRVIQDLLNHEESVGEFAKAAGLLQLLEETVKHFSQMRTGQLAKWTMQKGSPWDLAPKDLPFEERIIDDEDMAKYFKSMLRHSLKD